jgi:hypothetical protein
MIHLFYFCKLRILFPFGKRYELSVPGKSGCSTKYMDYALNRSC